MTIGFSGFDHRLPRHGGEIVRLENVNTINKHIRIQTFYNINYIITYNSCT